MSASDLVASFGSAVTVTRYGVGSYVNGTYAAGTTSSFTTTMSWQPINGRELLNLSEAQRSRKFLKGYCADQLLTINQSESKKADIVTIDSVNYEVQQVEYWESNDSTIAPYWKVLMAEDNLS